MNNKYLLAILIVCMNFRILSFADEIGQDGTWTYVSASIPYELEGMQEPPDTAVLTIYDDSTGLEYEREVPLKEIREKEQIWTENFSFPITVSGYDSDVFLLGEIEIPADENLVVYGNELLKAADLPTDCYRVESVEWLGEPYEKEGILFRDAVAKGEKLVRKVEVFYGGQVRMPQIKTIPDEEADSAAAETEIEETMPVETEEQKNMAETAPEIMEEPITFIEQELSLFDQVSQWVREHLVVVTFSIGIPLILAAAAVFIRYKAKRKSRD